MADPAIESDTDDDTGRRNDDDSTTNTPRWVQVLGIIALVAVLLFAFSQLTGGGHGPGRHMPARVTDQGEHQP